MRRWIAPLLVMSLASCAYMTRDEFDELFDQDKDGWGADEDCNDLDALIHPFAPDLRGDFCDADCGEEPDADGDDWPDDSDCAPEDPLIYPCSPNESEGDGKDSDCDGHDGIRDIEMHPCNNAPGFDDRYGLDPDFKPAPSATEDETQTILPADCLD